MPAPPSPPSIPDFQLLYRIGCGSYGDVWLARGVTGAFRAVKIVWRDRFAELRPYEREFEGITRFAEVSLREPSQLALLHAGRNGAAGFFYYVMELADDVVRGRDIVAEAYQPNTLKEIMRQRGRMPAAEAVALGVPLARALATLHAAGLVHRDIKPSNIILVGGVPKLADVGLVAAASAQQTFVGTEGFVPPEGPGAPAADVYSLGKVLYELATGRDRNDFPKLPEKLGELADRREFLELNEVLLRACEPVADRRFPAGEALLEELLLLQAGKSVRRLRKVERRLTRAVRVAAMLFVVAAVASLGAWIERTRRAQAEAERDALARRTVYAARISQAQRAMELEDYGRARRILRDAAPETGEPDLRRYEWRVMENEAKGDPAELLRAEGPAGQRLCFSPDGETLAGQFANQEVVLWGGRPWRETGRVKGVRVMAGISADGAYVYGTNAKGELGRWSRPDGSEQAVEKGGSNWPIGRIEGDRWLVFTPGAFAGAGGVRCWNFASMKEEWRKAAPSMPEEKPGDYYSSAISPRGDVAALGVLHGRGQAARWRLWVFSLPDLAVKWTEPTAHRPTGLSFSPDGAQLVCAWGDTGEVQCLDWRTGEWRWRAQLGISQITALACTGRGILAAGGRSTKLVLLDLATGAVTGYRRGHESSVQEAVFRSGTAELLSTGNGGDVRRWLPPDQAPPRMLTGFWQPAGGGRALCLSPDGQWLAATSGAGQTTLVRTNDGSRPFPPVEGVVAPIAFSPTGDELWTIGETGTLQACRRDTPGQWVRQISLPIKPITAGMSSDRRYAAAVDEKGMLVFVDTANGKVSAPIDTRHGYPYWVAVSPDGRLAATGGRDSVTRIWDVAETRLVREWPTSTTVLNGAFSPRGRSLAMLLGTGLLEVREVEGARPPRTVITSSGVLQAIVFHPAEPRLFLGGRDGTIHVIDTDAWSELAQLRAAAPAEQVGTMTRAAIDGAGAILAGYTENGSIRIWRH